MNAWVKKEKAEWVKAKKKVDENSIKKAVYHEGWVDFMNCVSHCLGHLGYDSNMCYGIVYRGKSGRESRIYKYIKPDMTRSGIYLSVGEDTFLREDGDGGWVEVPPMAVCDMVRGLIDTETEAGRWLSVNTWGWFDKMKGHRFIGMERGGLFE